LRFQGVATNPKQTRHQFGERLIGHSSSAWGRSCSSRSADGFRSRRRERREGGTVPGRRGLESASGSWSAGTCCAPSDGCHRCPASPASSRPALSGGRRSSVSGSSATETEMSGAICKANRQAPTRAPPRQLSGQSIWLNALIHLKPPLSPNHCCDPTVIDP
jgi:hypothetical protein